MVAGVADQADIFLLPRIGEGAEHLVLEHVGEADDRVERGAQFMADDGQEAALGNLDLVGASRASANAARSAATSLVLPEEDHHRLIGIAGVGEFEPEVRIVGVARRPPTPAARAA